LQMQVLTKQCGSTSGITKDLRPLSGKTKDLRS
jgi:hypothetical protein